MLDRYQGTKNWAIYPTRSYPHRRIPSVDQDQSSAEDPVQTKFSIREGKRNDLVLKPRGEHV